MASISGSVTIAGDPDDWIACAFDADTHAFAGVAAVASGTYSISGLIAGRAYVVACRPKTGPAWQANSGDYAESDIIIPTDPSADPYIFKALSASAGDLYWDNTQLLLHLDGTDGSTTITDEKGHTLTCSGSAALDTDQKKFGAASLYIPTDPGYISATDSDDFTISGDFTIEMQIRPPSNTASGRVLCRIAGASTLQISTASGKVNASVFGTTINGTSTINAADWNSVALCRIGSTVELFLNGVSQGTSTTSTNLNPTTVAFGGASGYVSYLGHIDEIRYTVGVGRYSGSYTPASAAFISSLAEPTGSTEPAWTTTPGSTVNDGGYVWTNMGQLVQPLMHGPLIAA